MRRTLVAAVAAALLVTATAAPASARPPALPALDPGALERVIAGLPDADASGALVRISGRAGRWSGTSGTARLGTGLPVPENARFRIGSATKVFTAVTVLHLVARGRLGLDDTVQRHLPGLLTPDFAPVTIRQLLNHTHGIAGHALPHKDPAWFLAHRYDDFDPEQVVRAGIARGPQFTPGSAQQYGNVGYLVAGLVVERVTGRPYAEAVREAVLRPLGLRDTSVPGHDTTIPGPHARGYEAVTVDGRTEHVDVTEADPSLQWAAAEMISSARDLDRFAAALFAGRLLPPRLTEEVFTLPRGADGRVLPGATYSAGLQRLEVNGHVLWGKTGDRPGYLSGVGSTRDGARRLVYSINTLHMGQAPPALMHDVVSAAFGPSAG